MIDHVGFAVSDYARAKAFYARALAPLGYELVMEVPGETNQSGFPAAGFGAGGKPDFWIGGEGKLEKPLHVAIVAKDRAAVDAFHKAALAAGGKDHGAARPAPALPSKLLRGLRARPRRPQHRGGLPRAWRMMPAWHGWIAKARVEAFGNATKVLLTAPPAAFMMGAGDSHVEAASAGHHRRRRLRRAGSGQGAAPRAGRYHRARRA